MDIELVDWFKLCVEGDINKIDKFLDRNKLIIYKSDQYGNSCCHYCIMYKNYDLLFYLLSIDFNLINLVNDERQTFLYLLINDNDLNVINKILDIFDNNIMTNNDEIRKCVNFVTYNNFTCLLKLIDKNDHKYYNVIKRIIKYTDINKPIINLPLNYALKIGNIELVKLLIDSNADVNKMDKKQFTPLIIALNKKNKKNEKIDNEIIKYLLLKGANINFAGPNDSHFPLNIIIKSNDVELFNIIMDHKPDTSFCDKYMNTPLHNALLLNGKVSLELIRKLIIASDINKPNMDGLTPLIILAKNKMIDEYIDILKNKEINFFMVDKMGNTPIKYMGSVTFVNLLNKITNNKIKKYIYTSVNDVQTCLNLESCRTKIKENIIKKSNKNIFNSVMVPQVKNTNAPLFNSDVCHNIIYLLYILKKYDNIFIPYQEFYPEKFMDVLSKTDTNTYKRNMEWC